MYGPVLNRPVELIVEESLFNAQAALMPFFAEYQQRTSRQIPVVVLERIN
jgi:hypothetical protein